MAEPTSIFKRTLKSALGFFLTTTQITKIEKISEHFVLIEMTGTKLKESNWLPGGKIQVDVGDLTYRTYTPIDVNKNEGKLSMICYKRSDGKASIWINALKVGDPCEVFGPRESFDFSGIEGDAVLFGDETSFGIAKVLQNKVGNQSHLFFELTSAETGKNTLEQLGISWQNITQRSPNDVHLQKMAESILDSISKFPEANIFLTGRAKSIQQIRTYLKNSNVPTNKFKVRAYWAEGKIGLD
ncbi:FAD-binding oxidoreductase [Leptospira sp. 96542]|nr:FAD-binding oxidoreductase [Leptospira sp. 96542]